VIALPRLRVVVFCICSNAVCVTNPKVSVPARVIDNLSSFANVLKYRRSLLDTVTRVSASLGELMLYLR